MTISWIKFAFANLLRNRRRSFYTVFAVAIGFAAVNVFGGFTAYIFRSLKDSFIYQHANGHLTVFKEGFLSEGRIDPVKYLITSKEMGVIRDVCSGSPRIVIATPQLQIMGLISNGKVSTIFVGTGKVPSHTKLIQSRAGGLMSELKHYQGRDMQDDMVYGIGLTSGLAEKLKLDIGSNAIAIAPTVDGRVNALDAEILQIFNVPMEGLNDKVIMTSLTFAQSLYDTDSIDRMTILLNKDEDLKPVRAYLEERFKGSESKLMIKSWQELSPFYTKVRDMFDIIFIFIFIIVAIIVVTSVINTLSMSVIERTREIGTLRALGLKRSGVVRLFALESAILAVLGSICGLTLTVLGWLMIKALNPQWIPPSTVVEIPLEIYLVPIYMMVSLAFLVLLSTLVAVLPARKAAHKSVVEALGHA